MAGIYKKSFVVIIILCNIFNTNAQDHLTFFRKLSTKEGLSENHINCIHQDKKGFIWIGTDAGLNRFDGYEFKKFFFDPIGDTIFRSNIIQCIDEDSKGNLWIGTPDKGNYRFNTNTETYTHFGNRDGDERYFFSNSAGAVIVANDNEIWFSGIEGVDILRLKDNDEFEVFNYPTDSIHGINLIIRSQRKFILDEHGQMWIATSDGLLKAIKSTGGIFPYILKKIENFKWEAIHGVDYHNGYFFVTLESGLYRLKVEGEKVVETLQIAPEYYMPVRVDNSGNVWTGHKYGLVCYRYNSVTDNYYYEKSFKADVRDKGSISENLIREIEVDRTGILWIGTSTQGLNILNPNRKRFYHYPYFADVTDPTGGVIRSVYEDSKANLWLGTSGGGIYFVAKNNRANLIENAYHYIPEGDINGYNSIFCYLEATIKNEPYMLIGMGYPIKLGYIHYSQIEKRNFKITPVKDFPSNVIQLMLDSEGVVWACTYGNGLFRLYPSDTGLLRWEKIEESLSSNIIRNVLEDHEGNIWVGTAQGLNLIKKSERYKAKPSVTLFKYSRNEKGISHDYILSMLQTKDKTIWIGTMGGGLNKVTKNVDGSYNFETLLMATGLADNTIKGLLEDDRGNIWISSNNGLTKLNPQSYVVRNYGINDGLQADEFLDLSCMKSRTGELFFGGMNGLNSFFPKEITENQNTTIPIFTELQVLNKTVEINEKVNNRILLEKSITSTDQIELLHRESSFSIKYTALDYSSPAKNSFKYKLEGFDNDWITTDGDNRIAKYTNLNPGRYTFLLKASNNHLKWNQTPAVIKIKVKPPWWMTSFAYVLYGLLFISALLFFRKFSLISIQKKNALLLEKFEKEKMEELTQLKLRFFTNISHELRTPLSLIQGPVKKLLDTKNSIQEGQRRKLYKLIDTNSTQILSLVDQLLDFRKVEQKKYKLNVCEADIVSFCQSHTENFKHWANQKNIELTFDTELEQKFIWFDVDVYKKTLNNLIVNAIKYTPEGGEVAVKLNYNESTGKANINIEDTGIGISEEDIPHIFERFYQVKDGSGKKDKGGTGIGLSFVYNLISIHKGEITCASSEGQGSVFSFNCPNRKDNYEPEELGIEDSEMIAETIERTPDDNIEYIDEDMSHLERRNKGGEITILIVDDNKEITDFITDNLPKNYHCLKAYNGVEGLKLADEKQPDIIISDVMMPEMDGIEFCNRIKSNIETSHIPVVLLSAKVSGADKMKGYDTGADAYVTKPFSIELLISHIEAILRNRQLLKTRFKQQINIEPNEVTVTNQDEVFLKKLIEIVEENFLTTDFKIDILAREIGKSVTQLNLKIKALTGLSTGAFIRTLRLKRAAQLLEKSDLLVSEIIIQVGFNDLKYFRNCFKKEFGKTPSDYRDWVRRQDEASQGGEPN